MSTPCEKYAGSAELSVSRYDRASSLLVALLLVVGAVVMMTLLVWLALPTTLAPKSIPVRMVEGASVHSKVAGLTGEFEAPALEEVPGLSEPRLETSMAALVAAVGTLQVPEGLETARSPATWELAPDDVIPRGKRWEIRLASSDVDVYARQLDFFQIELGAVGGGKKEIDYACSFSTAPRTRSGPGHAEQRLYMTWRGDSRLERFDRELLARAGVQTTGRLVLHFYPADVEDRLAWLERLNAPGKTVHEFFKTVFEVRPEGNGWEFFVVEQRFRPTPPLGPSRR